MCKRRFGLIGAALGAVLLLASSCGKSASQGGDSRLQATTSIDADGTLTLPSMPDSIKDPTGRADYLAAHFWDSLDFADTAHSLDTAFMEQNFANYSTVLPLTSEQGRTKAVSAVLDRARAASAASYELMAAIAEKYLYEPDSPMFDEEAYLPFADYAVGLGDEMSAAAEGRRDDILKNRPGTPAPDFVFMTTDAKRRRLSESDPLTNTLLIFYEPDCDKCHEAMTLLAGSQMLQGAVAQGTLRVVAVYPGDNRKVWAEHAATLPSNWIVGIDPTGSIDNDELYLIRATPTFYLIGADGKIILKDASLQRLAYTLGL